jgi:hypothetical protein
LQYLSKNQIPLPHILPMRGRMRSFDQGSIRAKRESVAAGNDPKGESLRDESSFPHHHHFFALPQQKSNSFTPYSAHAGKDEKLRPRFDSSKARKRCRRQRSEGRVATVPGKKNRPLQAAFIIIL